MPLLFADDTDLFQYGSDAHRMQQGINVDLKQKSRWLKISLHVHKTHLWHSGINIHQNRILTAKLEDMNLNMHKRSKQISLA